MITAAAKQHRFGSARLRIAFSIGVILSLVGVASAEVAVDTVVSGLHRPRGIAVRPGGTADRFEIFVADTGAGRILSWSNQSPDKSSEIITGLDANKSADTASQTGPTAVGFFDLGLLIVGTTQGKDGSLLRSFELQDNEKVLAPKDASEATTPYAGMNGATCTALARARVNEFVRDRLFLAVRGINGDARLWSARVQAGTIRAPKHFGAGEPAEALAIAISNTGRVVVADARGKLIFYSPVDGEVELALDTDLKQPLGLAYNPSTGSLYAADFARGIYRIDDTSQPGSPACRTIKVADARQPTALTFAPDGSLYVLTIGSSNNDGTLSVVTGEF